MASKPKRPCAAPGCRSLADSGYCPEHQQIVRDQKRERNKQYDLRQRDKQARDFYRSAEWEWLRQQALMRDHGLCQDCLDQQHIRTADVVDHIKPVRPFWHLRLRLDNLRSLCHPHHNRKTAEDKKRYLS
ncbi:HNH endonuclease [Brevibacillus agri]|uniref:HNH endonuclease n=1 Tax=Brevibacillus agri TaxID=51101 RepID=UPI002E22C000|nr:HNH endonuclease [Brevibacillus agri]MED1642149.1 HNH endonuclease [Brevibacillus agri]MED1654436.1 HNH endonuclease [Brevibacillus agri]MED1688119.1 HNH endonuclease [Brevibacillus agri]MED1691151.1 HNH endonuclease [Brevibacillus agri]MED1699387.1 HNH endonuclease [Brevibacillus agri]